MRKKANEPNFNLELPDDDEPEGNHWIDSLNGSRETVAEYVNSISDEDIKTAIDMIRNAKETDNNAQGLISNSTDFRSANVETFLFNFGASVSLMGECLPGPSFQVCP